MKNSFFHKRLRCSFLIFALFAFGLNQPAKAERGEIIESKSLISFNVTSNFHKFRGNINKFSGFIYGDNRDLKSVNFLQLEFIPNHFSTKNVARDLNMKKMFSVDENPLIVFKSTHVVVSNDRSLADIKGKLTINGITKKVNFTANLSKLSNSEIKAKGSFPLKLSDFKLSPPAPAFIRVNNLVQVEFDAVANWSY
ncbi:MAG: YceI family protein [Candidatus Caenarcaniphilales bacterium]|nr:YceI family protein [Candidatus Caenarcaniphilales bacterium]